MWQRLAKALSTVFTNYLQKPAVAAILKSLGLAGGFWTWLTTLLVKWGWKKADKEIQSQARLADRIKSDKDVREEYQKKIEENASEDELIKTELDILDPRRSRLH